MSYHEKEKLILNMDPTGMKTIPSTGVTQLERYGFTVPTYNKIIYNWCVSQPCWRYVILSLIIKEILVDKNTDETTNLTMFNTIYKLTSACKHNKIKEIENLIKNNTLLKKIANQILHPDLKSLEFKNDLKWKLLEECYKMCSSNSNNDRFFFAAATFDLEELNNIIEQHDLDFINQTRYLDSVIVFVLKYANIAHDQFLQCMKLLIDAGVDVNLPDFYGKMAIDHVSTLYSDYQQHLQEFVKMLFKKGLCKSECESTVKFIEDLETEDNYIEMNDKNKMFYWIATKKTGKVLNLKLHEVNFDINFKNGEYTFLQFACKKNDIKVVLYLLDNGADPNMTTKFMTMTPLELVARNRRDDLFKKVLDHRSVVVTEKMFNNFVKWRSFIMNLKMFKMLLESEKLSPYFKYESTDNTPLHYAIRFSYKEAIEKILKRAPTSLHVTNKEKESPLDIINSSDLKNYFDSCLVPDRYQADFKSHEYKMLLRFGSLVENDYDEIRVIRKISKNSNLEQLLTHPLIHTFIDLKWTKIQKYFWITVALQAFLFLSLSVALYYIKSSLFATTVYVTLTIINILLKLFIMMKVSRRLWSLEHRTLHYCGEVTLVITLLFAFFNDACKAFAFVQMSILFLLTIGYHPRIAKWSVMLQKVFKTFTLLLFFFSLIIMAFAAAFHMLFQNSDHKFMTSFGKSIFITYVMTAGEINVEDVEYKDLGGYIIFFLFTMCLSLVIVNFWTGVAVNDIDKIERKAEVNAFKNVILFMRLVDTHVNANRFFKKYLSNCLLFPPLDPLKKLSEKSRGKLYDVDFFVNRKQQFEKVGFPERVRKICVEKIEQHFTEREKRESEEEILKQLQEIRKILNDIKFDANKDQDLSKVLKKEIPKKRR